MESTSTAKLSPSKLKVAISTLGCSRNEVDSEELAGRLEAAGWQLVSANEDADIAVINTCGFIETAKQDSINTLLEADNLKNQGKYKAVVAVGCMAQRYGQELEAALPETDGILGFDSYQEISQKLKEVLQGIKPEAPTPVDRRELLPISRIERKKPIINPLVRSRISSTFWAPLKIASGCDRRCAFCAIPQFRGAFQSRPIAEIIEEANWLSMNAVSEIFLVSENTTSFGKDLGDLTSMEKLLPQLAQIKRITRIRLSYLQPAEIRPSLLQSMISTDKVMPYFDISFQHASNKILRRMRRFGGAEEFLHLISQIRALSPLAGIRSNFIVGFPGEEEEDFEILENFISQAEFDAVGIFPYSDEDGTEGLTLDGKVPEEVILERVAKLSKVAEVSTTKRAEKRIGQKIFVLVEDLENCEGRCDFQAPEVDGSCVIKNLNPKQHKLGDYLYCEVVGNDGVDLIVEAIN